MKTAQQLIEEAREDLNKANKRLKYAEERVPAPALQTEEEMRSQWAREVLLPLVLRRTTARPTTDSPSDVQATECTDQPLLRLSLWGHLDTRPGLAGVGCSFAPGWDALSASEKTAALDVAILSLTSQKRAIESSAALPAGAPAESPSPESSEIRGFPPAELRGVPQVYHMDVVDAFHVRLTPVAW